MKSTTLLAAIFLLSLSADRAGGRHHWRPENPRRRSGPDRQPPYPARRHRCAGGGSALPQHQGRTLDLRRRRTGRTDQALRGQELDLPDQRRQTAAAAPWRAAAPTARTSRNGWCRTAGRWRTRGSRATMRRMRKPRAKPRPGCGRAHSLRRGTGASATRRLPFSARSSRRRTPRRSFLASASGSVAPSPDCTIKGNVNRSGECIFHQPTSRWYAKIEMKISKGTRWFCSVDEAEAAGCRETQAVFFLLPLPVKERGEGEGSHHFLQCNALPITRPINHCHGKSVAGCGAR